MKIQRQRFAIMRKNRTEILAGTATQYDFKKIDELKGASVKSYRSESQAEQACRCWSHSWLGNYEIVAITETIEIEV